MLAKYPLPAHDARRDSRVRSHSPTPRRSSTPTPRGGRYITEKRIKRYGKAVDLFDRDDKTKRILEKLDEPVSPCRSTRKPLSKMSSNTSSRRRRPRPISGIPIYVDPIGLQEAEKSMTSTVRNMDLEGVPLKITLETAPQAARA